MPRGRRPRRRGPGVLVAPETTRPAARCRHRRRLRHAAGDDGGRAAAPAALRHRHLLGQHAASDARDAPAASARPRERRQPREPRESRESGVVHLQPGRPADVGVRPSRAADVGVQPRSAAAVAAAVAAARRVAAVLRPRRAGRRGRGRRPRRHDGRRQRRRRQPRARPRHLEVRLHRVEPGDQQPGRRPRVTCRQPGVRRGSRRAIVWERTGDDARRPGGVCRAGVPRARRLPTASSSTVHTRTLMLS